MPCRAYNERMDQKEIRTIVDPALPGPENMARDEALLVGVENGESPATIRYYQWDPPTISLGYFQEYAEYERLPLPAGGLPVVRRTTGGGAILHDRELTYSIALPLQHSILGGGLNSLYEIAHDALIAALDEVEAGAGRCGVSDDSGPARGPFFCFARRHCLDVLVKGDKLAGSAQRRLRHAVLQHGSIVLERRYEQQPAAAVADQVSLSADVLAKRMSVALGRATGMKLIEGKWSKAELAAAKELLEKYSGDVWTKRR